MNCPFEKDRGYVEIDGKTWFRVKFETGSHGAHTLRVKDVCDSKSYEYRETCRRTHPDGWTIEGEIHEDYYEWVNEFGASHPEFGRVWGDFEHEVFAESEQAYDKFTTDHEPECWDYWDI